MLHLIFSLAGFNRAQKHLTAEDNIVFLEDGCYVAQEVDGCKAYALKSHAKTRSIAIPSELTACTMTNLVEMVVECEKSISWK